MKIPRKAIQTFVLAALWVLGPGAAHGQKNMDHAMVPLGMLGETSSQVRLKLVDGTTIAADEAWESEQGIWYRRGGMSHLVPRDRVKAIERAVASGPRLNVQLATVVTTDDTNDPTDHAQDPNGSDSQPVWIYLIGGARVEADSAIESAAGVWYRRGSL